MDEKKLTLFSIRSFMILLFIIIVTIIPLAIRLKQVEFFSPVETWHRLVSVNTVEAFAQFRLELLVIATILLVITALLKYYYDLDKGIILGSYADFSIIVFALFILLSALLSPYMNLAFWGYYDRAEGSFAYLSYLVIFLTAAVFINAEKDKRIIFYAAMAAGLLQSLIAISQFFGVDVLQGDFAMRYFIPSELLGQVEEIEFRFANKAYGTTYNPNYLGGYMSMIFPMVFVMYLFSKTKRETIIWLAVFIITLAGFYAPTSIGAFASAGLAIFIFFLLTRKHFKQYYKKLVLALVIIIVVAGISDLLSGDRITSRISNLLTELTRPAVEEVATESYLSTPLPPPSGKTIELDIYRNPFDSFASHRGYIWRKSLEMMKSTILIGNGLDTYVYNFPHWDPHRPLELYPIGLLIDKPHNTYIQIAIGVGGLGLLAYLYIMFLHGKNYLQLFRRRGLKESKDVIMLALFIGWLGYLFQGLSNDSVLSNAPAFWALFGISVNYVKNAIQEETVVHRKETATKKVPETGTEKPRPPKQLINKTINSAPEAKKKRKSGSKKKK